MIDISSRRTLPLNIGFLTPALPAPIIHEPLPWPFIDPSRIDESFSPPKKDEGQLALLEQMVNIDSVTSHREGVNQIQQILAKHLHQIGFSISQMEHPQQASGNLLVATRAGKDPRFITFISHADTVLGPTKSHRFRLSQDQITAYGPGVIDNKGGLVVLLSALKKYLHRSPNHRYSLRVVISPNEETGSAGFTKTLKSFGKDSVMALGLEPALESGSIIQSRRGNRWYHIKVTGREAHAGRSYGHHVNAAHELAMKLSRLHKLTNYKKGISLNAGFIQGGRDRYNVVCGFAEAKIDLRFSSFSDRDRAHKKILKELKRSRIQSICKSFASQTEFTITDDCPPFSSQRKARGLINKYIQFIEIEEQKRISAERSGGAGDVSHLSHKDLICLDGLGPCGAGMHTEEESLEVSSLYTRAHALALLLEESEKLKI